VARSRILLLHDHPKVVQDIGRICLQYDASLYVAKTQSEIVERLGQEPNAPDLVIAKDVVPDWFTVAAALLSCRAFGRGTPFIIGTEPSDRWTRAAAEIAGSVVLIDDRLSRWLIPLLVKDWLERVENEQPLEKLPDHGASHAEGRLSVRSLDLDPHRSAFDRG
jgi:hypothetical protein